MNIAERDELVTDMARRVFAEEQAGRDVDPERLAWAASVLDQRPTLLQPAQITQEAA